MAAREGPRTRTDPGPTTPSTNPTLSLPSLPVGGDHYSSIDGNHPDNQCANVNWIVQSETADLVPGIEVAVTGVDFEPVGVHRGVGRL